jgi:PiT family inorganic phosphate transporter
MFTLLIVVIAIALLFDLVNGFHDAANSIATVVSTKVLTPFQAVVWAAAFNILAFWVFDMSVGNTVAKTVDSSAINLWVILAGLLAATFWNLLTWRLGIPSSSSHTLIGGFAGAAVAHAGFDVIETGEILKVVLFIFLAPFIGGIIAFIIALVTISRSFLKKMTVILILSGITFYFMNYMIEFMDMKPIMLYIVVGMVAVFILVYIWFEIAYGKKPSAMKESNMHKRLQLLSSAAFSLGHGGADSQKVMGIICAALMVYGNYARDNKISVNKDLQVTELIQIEYKDKDGKKEKFKPEYENEEKLFVYTNGKKIYDQASNELIFDDKKINPKYSHAGIFKDFIGKEGELLKDHKIKEGILTLKNANKLALIYKT